MGRPEQKVPIENEKVTNIWRVRKENWPYYCVWIIHFAWVIAFTSWWTAPPITFEFWGVQLFFALHIINLISTVFFAIIIKKEKYVLFARCGIVGLLISTLLFMLINNSTVHYILTFFIGTFMGCTNVGILVPFSFVLNNTEKFYSVVFANFLISILFYLINNGILEKETDFLFSFFMLVCGVICTFFFRNNKLPDGNYAPPGKIPEKGSYYFLAISCVFCLISKGLGHVILDVAQNSSSLNLHNWNLLGSVLGCICYVLIYAFTNKCMRIAWEVVFSSFIVAMVCYAFSDKIPTLYVPFSILLGVSGTAGIINSYYVVGVITKKYSSMKYLRLYTVINGLFSAPAILISYIMSENAMSILLVITCLISTIIMIMLLAISPLLDKGNNKDWIDDSKFAEVSNKQRNKMNFYGFSKREFEVCELLIEGHTMRQIAGILGISYSTVNTYCTSIYRKVGINSRVELLKIFQKISE